MEWERDRPGCRFHRLDAGSDRAAYVTPSLLLREGKIADATKQ